MKYRKHMLSYSQNHTSTFSSDLEVRGQASDKLPKVCKLIVNFVRLRSRPMSSVNPELI